VARVWRCLTDASSSCSRLIRGVGPQYDVPAHGNGCAASCVDALLPMRETGIHVDPGANRGDRGAYQLHDYAASSNDSSVSECLWQFRLNKPGLGAMRHRADHGRNGHGAHAWRRTECLWMSLQSENWRVSLSSVSWLWLRM
jgi:hypothetical protein